MRPMDWYDTFAPMTDDAEIRKLRAEAHRLQLAAMQARRAAIEATKHYREAVQAVYGMVLKDGELIRVDTGSRQKETDDHRS